VQAGQTLDTAIEIEVLADVLHVGRPVFGRSGATVWIFKVEPDGAHAVRVPVLFGRASVN